MTTVTAKQLKEASAEVLSRVQYGHERIAVTRHGKEVAAVVSIEDVRLLERLEDVLDVFPENARFVIGHGRDLDAAGLRAYRDTLEEMIDVVRKNVAAGRTAEQMVAEKVVRIDRAEEILKGMK